MLIYRLGYSLLVHVAVADRAAMIRLTAVGKHDGHLAAASWGWAHHCRLFRSETLLKCCHVLQFSLQQGGFPVLQPIVTHGS